MLSRKVIFIVVLLLPRESMAQKEILSLPSDVNPSEIFFQKFGDKMFLEYSGKDSAGFSIKRTFWIDTLGNISPIRRITISRQHAFAGFQVGDAGVTNYVARLNGKNFTLVAIDPFRTSKEIYRTKDKVVAAFADDFYYVVTWRKETSTVRVIRIKADQVVAEIDLPFEKKFKYFFEKGSAQFFDTNGNAYDAFAGLAELKLYKRGDRLYALMDNIFYGTSLGEFNLSAGTFSLIKFPFIEGEIAGLTNAVITGNKLIRTAVGESGISVASFDILGHLQPSVARLDINSDQPIPVYVSDTSTGLLQKLRSKERFRINPDEQKITTIAMANEDSSLTVLAGQYFFKKRDQRQVLAVSFGLLGGALSSALQQSGDLHWFYLTLQDGRLTVPEKPTNVLHKVDEYETLVNAATRVRLRNKAMINSNGRVFLLFWDRKADLIRLLKFLNSRE